ncbi:MAG: hypothetical protein FJY92_10225 [Candidatus Hydrogenedentes bacterium]|nr:hypothetical protein [Candidatus Hydrogenedentota bacterium]
MIRAALTVTLALMVCVGCGAPKPVAEAPPPEESASKIPSLDDAVSKLKDGLKNTTDAAKAKIAENAEVEIDRIFQQLDEVADDFAENADQLQGDAKDQFDEMRIAFEDKKVVFEQKLKEFKAGSAGAKAELLKGLYDALAEMKDALDRAAEAFRQGAAPPAKTQPSSTPA